MSARRSIAVMGVRRPAYFNQVLMRARVVVLALTENNSIYPIPDPPLSALASGADVLQNYINLVNEGDHSKIGLRNEASIDLYELLRQELVYVNKIGKHDRGILSQSGFPVNAMPEPQPIPPRIIVKRIIDSKMQSTAKIFIESIHLRNTSYIVQQTKTPDIENSWKMILLSSNSRELFIKDLKYGEEVWFRICAINSAGQGQWSSTFSFISRN